MSFLVVLVAACKLVSGERIEGVYVNHSEGEYSLADDTLSISKWEGRQFRVLRRTGFNLIRDGVVGGREFDTEEWTLVYDKELGAYRELRWGKVLWLARDGRGLRIGKREYQRFRE